ncbi:helix-turn-helix domain-containing protein [Magnetococcales bacterium HHB-1]
MAQHNLQMIEFPSEQDVAIAIQGGRQLTEVLGQGKDVQQFLVDEHLEVTLPMSAIRLLTQILDQMAKGNAVSLVPIHAELTTQEAANFLSVSRPYLVKILEEGKIPFHKVGVRRRVLFKDLMAYRERRQEQKKTALNELAAQAQELDLGY